MATILIVDDDEAFRDSVAKMLTRGGHTVTHAADGNAALAALKTARFDVIVTDIVMPVKEGLETIMEIRDQYPANRIIAFSGAASGRRGNYLRTAEHLGAAATLEKPFTTQQLLDAVGIVLAMPAHAPPGDSSGTAAP